MSSTLPASTERHHALDLLRGCLMLLGVVLHGALFFTKGAAGTGWSVRDGAGHGFFNVLIGWIHLYRMPAFFLLAGFFGALLWRRRGPRGFLGHRARRVLLPLLAAWAILGPLVSSMVAGIIGARGQGLAAAAEFGWRHFVSGAWLFRANLLHLWFLWYLFLLCAGAWVVLGLGARLGGERRARIAGWLAGIAVSRYNIVVFILATALTLRPMRTAAIATGTSLWPRWSVLATYGVFFAIGWIWNSRADYLQTLARGWGWRLGFGAVFGLIATVLNFGTMQSQQRPSLVLLIVTAAGCWWCIMGLIGLFQRHFTAPLPAGRYLADSSYWVYLVHIPVLLALAALLRPWQAAIGVKYLALVAITLALCIASYQVCVRRTFIGVFLNGERRGPQPDGPAA